MADVISAVEASLSVILSRDSAALVDEEYVVSKEWRNRRGDVRRILVELENVGALRPRFFWICPNGGGTAQEAADISEFEDEVDCDRCGERHPFQQDAVEVHFLPSDELKRQLLKPPAE